MRFSRFIIGLTSCIAFSVQAANVDEYITQLPAGANLALMVQKVGASAPAIDYHSQQMALPASTQKVITALAALIQLGPDFRFTTTLETKGNVENGVLKGDLVARFGADPTLKRQDIRNMVATLKKSGVNQIDGNVLIDTSIFASHDKAPGWPWNDMTQCFSAPPAAAIVDRNCFSVSLYSAPKPGDMAFIRVASYYPVTMFSQVRTLPRGSDISATLNISADDQGRLLLELQNDNLNHNRIWLRLAAQPEDHIYGCGEQFSYFDLRGKPFPLWTSEQGVGRNKQTYVTWQADCKENAGGDYYWTFFPQPTFVSTQKYYCHVDNSCYMNFDFSAPEYHELALWEDKATLRFECADTYISLLEKLTALLGRQPELPDWIYDGVTLGIQGGTEVCQKKLDTMRNAGVKVNGIWAQDWSGIRMTSFGKRVMWNWKWNSENYPQLDSRIKQWNQEGVQFLAYINPYVASDKDLCEEAAKRGYLAKDASGGDYLVEFGEFYGGVVDLTNPEAYAWFKEVIKKNMIELGCGGWMADFGEYLPTDTYLHNGVSAEIMHNAWPALWAKCNYEALEETGKLGEILFFMRAGSTGSQKYSTMMWAGDQNVDWSLDDGLASVVPAALSLAMTGHGLHHSDIGGYTTLFEMKRSKELLLRWCDFSAFTPMMRTHEGNRPGDNWQFDGDAETIAHFARMTTVFTTLKPYLKEAVALNAKSGLPVMRPLFLHYEDDAHTYTLKYQYLLGRDILVAPVHEEGRSDWTLYLPEDNWVHVWTGEAFRGGEVTVNAPIGKPPVFYRADSEWAALFASLKSI
ncbi:alpha-glucosidase [Escherichia coli]|nr:alpha-glucosidase [Escherichia coli]